MTTINEMLADIDDVMFIPTSWMAIDVNNQPIVGLRSGNRADALAWIGHERVATIFGRLRPGFCAVDIDVQTRRLGESIVEHIAGWCEARGMWHIVRPSGGAAGKHHIFIQRDLNDPDGFREMVEDLREQHDLPQKLVDPRIPMRPLTAPHRCGGTPLPYGGREGIRELWKTLPGVETLPRRRRRKPMVKVDQALDAPSGALLSPARFRRNLPKEWALYLEEGTLPLLGGTDHSNSTYEARATKEMVIAGFSAEEAWTRICNAHLTAMGKARSSQTQWIRWVWNKAVRDYAEFLKTTPREPQDRTAAAPRPSTPLAEDLVAARSAVWQLLWTVTPRRRDALFRVATAVLDRIERTGARQVPIPERDLVLDAGIASRRTIRDAIAAIDGLLGTVIRDTWDPSDRETSSFEFILRANWRRGLSEISPPSSHTPLPATTWATLPRSAPRVWASLNTGGSTIEEIAEVAALTDTPSGSLTVSQRRTLELVLKALSEAGLSVCGADGRWHPRRSATDEHRARSQGIHERLLMVVTEERRQYRKAQGPSWNRQQQLAIAKDHDRYQRWWNTLDANERARRRATWRATFDELSVFEQETLKDQLARNRRRAGIDEATRHREWVEKTPPDELAQRIIERTYWFKALPGSLKQVHVQAWNRHRGRHQVPRLAAVPSIAERRKAEPNDVNTKFEQLMLSDIADAS